MYTVDSINKAIRHMRTRGAELEKLAARDIPLCISKGNKKIGSVMNVSLPPVLSCGNCRECKKLCYDIKAILQYPGTVADARMRNFTVLQKDREGFFSRIDEAMSRRRKNKFFRWHVAGDIVDIDYFDRMVKIARDHPDFTIWTYTKMYHIVNAWLDDNGPLPENFTVMFSEWRGMPMENPHGMPEFRVVFKDETPPAGFYCPGNCDVCKNLHKGCVAGETVYCKEH